MDRVTLLDLQECLQNATSTKELELQQVHTRTFSRLAKQHAEVVNEGVARCWDWVSAIQIATPVSKNSKYMQHEVTLVYTRMLLAWRFLMFIVKKSQWATKFLLEQPKLNLLCQGILHLISLHPIHRNQWEKPLAKTLATVIFQDLTRMGSLISSKPLKLALDHLRRNKVSEQLATRPPASVSSINRFYRLKFQLKSKDILATSIINQCREREGSSIRAFLTRSPYEEATATETQTSSSSSTMPASEQVKIATETSSTDPAPVPYEYDPNVEDDFEDIDFEDVEASQELLEPSIEQELAPKIPVAGSLENSSRLDEYRQSNRKIEEISNQIRIIQQKLQEITERQDWIPAQNAEYTALLRRIEDLLSLLALCTTANTEAIRACPEALTESQVVIDIQVRR